MGRKNKEMKKETEIEEIRGIETSAIEKLTDDCLIEIFQRLPTIADRIRIERVCKRWKSVSEKSWNNFKSLDFRAKTWGLKENLFHYPVIPRIDFYKIIKLSGRYLTSISTDILIFGRICYLLPNIRELKLLDLCSDQVTKCTYKVNDALHAYQRNTFETTSQCTYDPWQVILQWLLSHGKNITTFQLRVSHSHYKEEDFARFLGEMKQLESFCLYDCHYLNWSGTFLLELPVEIIQEIVLLTDYMLPFDSHLLSLMIKKCKKLQTFCIENFEGDDRIWKVLPSQAIHLKNLKLESIDYFDYYSVLWSKISVFVNLEKLSVKSSDFVSDVFLEVVGKYCKKLTYLELQGSNQVTDRGLSSVCDLEKLTYLKIAGLTEIRNPPLEKLTCLVVLDSSYSKNILEECLCSFLKKAHQLRAINVTGCPLITDKLFNVAKEVAKIRNSNKAHDSYVGETESNMKFRSQESPVIDIIRSCPVMGLAKYGIENLFDEIDDPEVYTY